MNILFLIYLKRQIKVYQFSDRSSHRRCSIEKVVLKIFAKYTGKHLCQSLFFNKVAGLLKKTLAKVFSREFCQIFKNKFFIEHILATASILNGVLHKNAVKKLHEIVLNRINSFMTEAVII